MRVLVACEFSGAVRDAFWSVGCHAVSCDLVPSTSPGIHYQGDVCDLLDGWEPVQFAARCDPDEAGWCEFTGCDVGECTCLGPTMDEVEYREVDGVLLGRPIDHPHWDLMIAHPPCTYLTIAAEWAYGDGPYHQKVKPQTLVGAARRAARLAATDFVAKLWNAPIPRICIENPVGVLKHRIGPASQTIQPYWFGADASKATCLWLKGLPPLEATDYVPPRITKHGKRRWSNQTDSGQNRLSPSETRAADRAKTYPGVALAMAEQWGGSLAKWQKVIPYQPVLPGL